MSIHVLNSAYLGFSEVGRSLYPTASVPILVVEEGAKLFHLVSCSENNICIKYFNYKCSNLKKI